MNSSLRWKVSAISAIVAFALFMGASQVLAVFDFLDPLRVVVIGLGMAFTFFLFIPFLLFILTIDKTEFSEKTILDNSMTGIFLAEPPLTMGTVIYINSSFAEQVGSTVELLSCNEFLPAEFLANPDERASLIDSMLQSDRITELEITFKRPDGTLWWGRLNSRTITSSMGERIQGTLTDISEKKKSEEVLQNYSETLEHEVGERTKERDEIQRVSILGLSKITEYRDPETGNHVIRMAHYSKILARALGRTKKYKGYITEKYVDEIFISAPLHDIGKVGIEDSILKKPGKLTNEEFDEMKNHTIYGGDTLKDIEKQLSFRSFLTLGKEIAYNHHQKWDGTGYPSYSPEGGQPTLHIKGHSPLKGTEIPLSARIVALADVYDALSSNRCYRKAFSHKETAEIIIKDRDTHFDPEVVDAFVDSEQEFIKVLESMQD